MDAKVFRLGEETCAKGNAFIRFNLYEVLHHQKDILLWGTITNSFLNQIVVKNKLKTISIEL